MKFFERFRVALSKYGEGVHLVGAPAAERAITEAEARLGRALPEAYRELLRQWNGALLFHEAIALHGVAGAPAGLDALAPAPEGRIDVGRDERSRLFLDGAGRVLALDEDTERLTVVGSTFDRWLDATLAREGLLYDRDGEFREGVFDGDELLPSVARKRAEAAVKADPDATAWHVELGRLLADAGRDSAAIGELERAAALDPASAEAWLSLGRLRRKSGALDGALAAFVAAARGEAALPPEEAAFALAQAAAVARQLGRAAAADAHAAEALELHPPLLDEQKAAAAHLLDARDFDAARDRLDVARALAPADPDLARLDARLRSARALRPV